MELSHRPLEAELAEIAERAEPGRTAQIAVRYWGWNGRGGATLEVTGREVGITRERVRQLCERLAGKLAGTAVEAPALDRALVLAAHAAPTTASDLARRLADEHISARAFDPAGLLSAAAVLGRESTFSLETVKDVRVVVPYPADPASDTVAVIAAVVDTARAIVRRAGAARVGEVTGRVAADLAVWVDDALVTAMLSEPADFVWLERRTGWFYLSSVAKNAVASRVAKVLSVSGAVRLADLHAGIRRDERMREFVMPEYILGELCERLPGVRVDDDVVSAEHPLAPEDVLEGAELTLLRALVAAGGRMARRELEAACLAAGMKLSSFNNRVAYSPIITDVGHATYGLRGLGDGQAEESGRHRGPYTADPETAVPRPGDLATFRPPRRR